jgi:hypothetical protein
MRALADIVRLRTAECRQAATRLPALAAGEPAIDERLGRHVAECLRCQAEVAAYRRILRHLRSLRDDETAPPTGAIADVLEAIAAASLEESAPGTSRILRAAYVGGITVATAAAGAAGVLVWMSRRRPGLADTG